MRVFSTFFFLLLSSALLQGQSFTTVADSLRLPLGLEAAADGQLWVVETGYGFDDGAVSLLQPDGTMLPVVVGLPSLFDTTTQENVGPWHTLALPGNQLAVTSGASGEVLIFDLSGFIPGMSAPLTLADSLTTIDIRGYALSHGFLESDPYSLTRDHAGNLYVADAAANAIFRVTAAGQLSVFATFPPFPNPLPFGPPMVDAVPTRILAKPGGGFYVSQLTGFPFLDGAANIFSVDAAGNVTPYAQGLTQLTDLALDANTGDLYALQFGHFDLMGMPPGFAPNSSKVIRIKTDGTRETVAENFGPSAGIALDGQGHLYVSDIFSGRVLQMENVATGLTEKPGIIENVSLSPNPASEVAHLTFSLKTGSPVLLRMHDVHGHLVMNRRFNALDAGRHHYDWQVADQPAGLYFIDIQTNSGVFGQKLMIR